MVVTILATGSRGDIQPYLALGQELQSLGYKVRLATFQNFASLVQAYSLAFYPVQGDVTEALLDDVSRKAMKADNPLKFFLSSHKLMKLVEDLQQDFFEACIGAEAIIYHPGATIGYFAAKQLKVPGILASPFPMTPTKEYPALLFYDSLRLGGIFNLITHEIFQKAFWLTLKPPLERFWRKRFGELPASFKSPFEQNKTESAPTVISCSEHVFPRPTDWPKNVHSLGYWFAKEAPDWQPPQDLLDFLASGKAPIYVGFGSMGDPEMALETTKIIIEALKKAGQRGILATGWSGMASQENNSTEIFFLKDIPHSWLFPKMAAVVHHGGAGTTAAGLRAGIPNIVVPHCNDQFAWGRRVLELGVGPKPIPRKKLNSENLASAIELALSKDLKARAEELGLKIKSENGASATAQVISEYLQRGSKYELEP